MFRYVGVFCFDMFMRYVHVYPRHQVVHDRPRSQHEFRITKHRYFLVAMSLRPKLVKIAMVQARNFGAKCFQRIWTFL
jgi:hypothetical protein